ncbi:MAG: hypothetical protein AAB597_03465 [Patescibacteria group bacterium]
MDSESSLSSLSLPPLASPSFSLSAIGLSEHLIFQALFLALLIWVVLYTLVLFYHWFRFGPKNIIVFVGAGLYCFVSFTLITALATFISV